MKKLTSNISVFREEEGQREVMTLFQLYRHTVLHSDDVRLLLSQCDNVADQLVANRCFAGLTKEVRQQVPNLKQMRLSALFGLHATYLKAVQLVASCTQARDLLNRLGRYE